MKAKNPEVDARLKKAERWQQEMERLRAIILDFEVTEELKWGKPFYSVNQGNVLVIWGFKEHCALGFCKGALLKDAKGLLVKPGEHTQATRKIPFTSLGEINEMEPVLRAYIQEAIEVEKAGLEVIYKDVSEFPLPQELHDKFDEDPAYKVAFQALTPGRQRGYLLNFSAPKQAATRSARIDKYRQQIFDGKGINDQGRAGKRK